MLSGVATSTIAPLLLTIREVIEIVSFLPVTPRPLTVSANAQTTFYGDAIPPLSYLVGGSGLVNGDTLTGALGTAATPTSGVGPS